MRRCTHLATFLILALLFCAIAGTIRQERPRPAEGEQRSAPPARESPREHLQGREARLSSFFSGKSAAGRDLPARETADGKKEKASGFPPPAARAKPASEEGPFQEGDFPPAEEAVHFLLIGRQHRNRPAAVLLVVTLIPESCARLTAIDPAIGVITRGKHYNIGELAAAKSDREELYRAVAELSGSEPQFYLELDLSGFTQMTALLDRHRETAFLSAAADEGGRKLLSLMCNFQAGADEIEELLIGYLLSASEISSTELGLKLLWLGYRHLSTDLSLSDLLSLRAVSQKISPLEVDFSTITEPLPQQSNRGGAPPVPLKNR